MKLRNPIAQNNTITKPRMFANAKIPLVGSLLALLLAAPYSFASYENDICVAQCQQNFTDCSSYCRDLSWQAAQQCATLISRCHLSASDSALACNGHCIVGDSTCHEMCDLSQSVADQECDNYIQGACAWDQNGDGEICDEECSSNYDDCFSACPC